MAMELFSTEYSALKAIVEREKFAEPLKTVMETAKDIFGDTGFKEERDKALELIRKQLKLKADEHILRSAGADPASRTGPSAAALDKAAAVKFLRHLYLTYKRGGQKVWVFDSPKAYRHYPTGELAAVRHNMTHIKAKLLDKAEQFGEKRRTALAQATTTGLAWCQKTNIALAQAKSNPKSKAMEMVRRWFADERTTAGELDTVVSTLAAGFKKVTATINSNQLIFTDMASIRGATDEQERGLLNAYAFVYSGRYEKIPVVYIENAFFGKNTSPLPDKTLWALTVVHELTHLDVSTKDHKYDFNGLQPGVKLSCAEARENADSWAYFCADCAGALSKSHIKRAMNGWS